MKTSAGGEFSTDLREFPQLAAVSPTGRVAPHCHQPVVEGEGFNAPAID
jgi:hypothetical protein